MLTLLEIWNGFGSVEVNLIMLNLLCESQDKPLEEDEETVGELKLLQTEESMKK